MGYSQWENLWSFKTARFRVSFDVAPEDDVDLSWDDTGEAREKIASGEWTCFQSRVVVYMDGVEIGADHLGNSIYADPRSFIDHRGLAAKRREDAMNYGSYFSDMVAEAVSQARLFLANTPRLRAA